MKWMKILGATALALGLASCEKIEKDELSAEDKELSTNLVAKEIPEGKLITWKEFLMHCSSKNLEAEENFKRYRKQKFVNWRGECVKMLESMTVKNSHRHSPQVIEIRMSPTEGGSSDLRLRFSNKFKEKLAKVFSDYSLDKNSLPPKILFSGEIRFIGGALRSPIVFVEDFSFQETARVAYESERLYLNGSSYDAFKISEKTLREALKEEPNPDKKIEGLNYAKKMSFWKELGPKYRELKYKEDQVVAREAVKNKWPRVFHNLNINEAIALGEQIKLSDPNFYTAVNFQWKPKKEDVESDEN